MKQYEKHQLQGSDFGESLGLRTGLGKETPRRHQKKRERVRRVRAVDVIYEKHELQGSDFGESLGQRTGYARRLPADIKIKK